VTSAESAPTVVALKAITRGRRVLVTGSDGSEHTYFAECIDAAGIGKGDTLDEKLLARLEIEQQRLKIHDAALSLLNHRDRSAWEIQTRLRQKGYEAALIETEVSRLKRAGLVDDEAFAKAWVSERVRLAPRSQRMLLHELANKGIAAELASSATELVRDDDTAKALAEKKALSLRARPKDDIAKKVKAFLVGKGYSHYLAARTAQEAAEEVTDGR